MFCPNCEKLAKVAANRICVRCQNKILNNISCICDACSIDQKVCSVCLKKISISQSGKSAFQFKAACKPCGR